MVKIRKDIFKLPGFIDVSPYRLVTYKDYYILGVKQGSDYKVIAQGVIQCDIDDGEHYFLGETGGIHKRYLEAIEDELNERIKNRPKLRLVQ